MRILHIISSIDPKGGGPMEGLRQYGMYAATLGHQIEVVSLDDPNADFIQKFPLKIYPLGPSHGKFRYNRNLTPWLLDNAKKYDAVIVNGLWQYHGHGAWKALKQLSTPYFVFTHGMLDPWFKKQYPLKHLKKWPYWIFSEYKLLRDARAVIFTSEEERIQAKKSFWLYKTRTEYVTAYGTTPPPTDKEHYKEIFLTQHPELKNKKILLFLSRIQEKKGCDMLISAFAKTVTDTSYHLVIAGPDQSGWVKQLQSQAISLGISERISWPGMLSGDLKWGAFYASEAFVLPSHQENFGIAVAEAMGCGLPVLISNKVNIWREILKDESGLVNDDTPRGTESTLRTWFSLDQTAQNKMATNSYRSFTSRYTVERMAHSLLTGISTMIEHANDYSK